MRHRMYFVAVDLGQSHDFTAIAVIERMELQGEWDAVMFAYRKKVELRVRYLERVPLGTPYPEIVRQIAEIVESLQVQGHCTLLVDASGVGRPVVDLLREARLRCDIVPVVVTGGQVESRSGGYYHVPKRDLICGLRVRLEKDSLRIAEELKHGPTLLSEMSDMRVKITAAGNEQYEAWREGSHDDLVFAVALGCWGVQRVSPYEGADMWCRGRLF